jgi:hypothetical protein
MFRHLCCAELHQQLLGKFRLPKEVDKGLGCILQFSFDHNLRFCGQTLRKSCAPFYCPSPTVFRTY